MAAAPAWFFPDARLPAARRERIDDQNRPRRVRRVYPGITQRGGLLWSRERRARASQLGAHSAHALRADLSPPEATDLSVRSRAQRESGDPARGSAART